MSNLINSNRFYVAYTAVMYAIGLAGAAILLITA